jgi:Rrf2 family transcriptional regulator, iron-responsive regulator
MRLTRQTSYAARTLMYCAVNAPDLSRVSDVAKSYGISELFLFKLIKPLVENQILETVRGRHGGIRLARPASEITLYDVISVTEENFALAECFEGGDTTCPLVAGCDLNSALHEALDAFFAVLRSYTIADLTDKRRAMRSRLGIEMLGLGELN